MSDYQPFYCEENVLRFLESRQEDGWYALWISNPAKSVAMWGQKAAPDPQNAIVWDYHVVAVRNHGKDQWLVWDYDTIFGLPCDIDRYLTYSFAGFRSPPEFHPNFRLVPSQEFTATFASDRRHMKSDGKFKKPPPPWPARQGWNLDLFWDMTPGEGPGEVFSAHSFARFVQVAYLS